MRSCEQKAHPPFKKRRLLGRLISRYIGSIVLAILTPESMRQKVSERSSHTTLTLTLCSKTTWCNLQECVYGIVQALPCPGVLPSLLAHMHNMFLPRPCKIGKFLPTGLSTGHICLVALTVLFEAARLLAVAPLLVTTLDRHLKRELISQ